MKTFTNFLGSLNDRNTSKTVLFPSYSSPIIKFCIIGLIVLFSIQLNAATNYLKNGTDATELSSWTTNSNGIGGTIPTNFTTYTDIFIIEAGETGFVSKNWTIGTTGGTILSTRNWNLNILGTLTVNNNSLINQY